MSEPHQPPDGEGDGIEPAHDPAPAGTADAPDVPQAVPAMGRRSGPPPDWLARVREAAPDWLEQTGPGDVMASPEGGPVRYPAPPERNRTELAIRTPEGAATAEPVMTWPGAVPGSAAPGLAIPDQAAGSDRDPDAGDGASSWDVPATPAPADVTRHAFPPLDLMTPDRAAASTIRAHPPAPRASVDPLVMPERPVSRHAPPVPATVAEDRPRVIPSWPELPAHGATPALPFGTAVLSAAGGRPGVAASTAGLPSSDRWPARPGPGAVPDVAPDVAPDRWPSLPPPPGDPTTDILAGDRERERWARLVRQQRGT